MRLRGLTTRDVGLAIGLDHSAVARWLKKGTRPYASSSIKLADFFDVPVDDLLDDSRDLLLEYIQPESQPAAVEESQVGNIARLEQAIEDLTREIASLRAERAAVEIAGSPAPPVDPAIAEALASGLTIVEVRAMLRAAALRSRQNKPHPGER